MLFDFIELDLNKKGELYNTLYTKIKVAVLCGAIKKGEKLPSVREAASQLSISRTTVENAYNKLCIEGIAESFPQKGYFITDFKDNRKQFSNIADKRYENIVYDFSGRSVDTLLADTEVWKKTVRNVLLITEELTSYGDSQGELILRQALSSYSYKARGITTTPENIVIGAGIGPLLNILCGLIGRQVKIGFENGGFKKAESVFADYDIETVILESDNNGALIESIIKSNIDVLFLTPSSLSKISVTALSKRRNEYMKWVNSANNRLIIEDDYNGELRFTARTVPAFQGKQPQKTVYIGSFSKLLLPSVRLAYMVLPPALSERFNARKNDFNQTCGKIEQLALSNYILSGGLEKHLRKLRRQYYTKSQLMLRELKNNFPSSKIKVFETSLIAELETDIDVSSDEIYKTLKSNGILVIPTGQKGSIKLSFASIKSECLPHAIEQIKTIFSLNW